MPRNQITRQGANCAQKKGVQITSCYVRRPSISFTNSKFYKLTMKQLDYYNSKVTVTPAHQLILEAVTHSKRGKSHTSWNHVENYHACKIIWTSANNIKVCNPPVCGSKSASCCRLITCHGGVDTCSRSVTVPGHPRNPPSVTVPSTGKVWENATDERHLNYRSIDRTHLASFWGQKCLVKFL